MNKVRIYELLKVPDMSNEDITVAEDEVDANWCT